MKWERLRTSATKQLELQEFQEAAAAAPLFSRSDSVAVGIVGGGGGGAK